MASTPTFQSNPYGSFDPSQWSNPYSNYYGQKLPWPATYAGTPTNAQGQAIQPPPGMTLNSTPAQPQAAPAAAGPATGSPAAAMAQAGYGNWSQLDPLLGHSSLPQAQGIVGSSNTTDQGTGFGQSSTPIYGPMQQQPQQQAAPQAAAPSAPNNWQQTLAMLANPGKVTTPGATVPAAPASGGQPTPGVLQNFLANWQPASSGAGSGFTQNFNTILRGLQSKGS
jgi:hypothetical protein